MIEIRWPSVVMVMAALATIVALVYFKANLETLGAIGSLAVVLAGTMRGMARKQHKPKLPEKIDESPKTENTEN